MSDEFGSRPVPDPTLLTTEQLLRSIASLREESKGWTDSLQLLMEEKLRGVGADAQNIDRSVREKIEGHVKNLETRLAGGDIALTAALQSADKAQQKQADNFDAVLGESKSSMTKQIDGLNEKIDDVKDRLNRVEATNLGVASNRMDTQQETALRHGGSQNLITGISAAASILAILISLVVAIYTISHQAGSVPDQRQYSHPVKM